MEVRENVRVKLWGFFNVLFRFNAFKLIFKNWSFFPC